MGRDWKPGDVALVDSWRGRGQLAFCCERIEGQPTWCVLDGTDTRGLTEDEVSFAQPVAVVAFEDREQVERLIECWAAVTGYGVNRMQAALREFANPTPPKLDEPQGLGAVVEDGSGKRWIAHEPDGLDAADNYRWLPAGNSVSRIRCQWSTIAAVRVLSEGVTA